MLDRIDDGWRGAWRELRPFVRAPIGNVGPLDRS